jgi:hypothetical protein
MNFGLKYFEEAYTTENWIVRIYRVKKRDNIMNIQYNEELDTTSSSVQALSGISDTAASNPYLRSNYLAKNAF